MVEGGKDDARVNVVQELTGIINEVHVSATRPTPDVRRSKNTAMGVLPKMRATPSFRVIIKDLKQL